MGNEAQKLCVGTIQKYGHKNRNSPVQPTRVSYDNVTFQLQRTNFRVQSYNFSIISPTFHPKIIRNFLISEVGNEWFSELFPPQFYYLRACFSCLKTQKWRDKEGGEALSLPFLLS